MTCGVTLAEIADIRSCVEALFRDSVSVGTPGTPSGQDPSDVTWTWGVAGPAGVDTSRPSEAVDGSGATVTDGDVRLPVTASVGTSNRLKVTVRDGATLTTPEYYRVVGEPTRGLSCLIVRVKRIVGGDSL